LSVSFTPNAAGTALFDDRHAESVSPSNVDLPGGNVTFCVEVWDVDLSTQAADSEVNVGTLTVNVVPR